MPDSLNDLLNADREARALFNALPMFARDTVLARADEIQTKEELSGIAHMAMHDALQLDAYSPMFEDETDSPIDLM